MALIEGRRRTLASRQRIHRALRRPRQGLLEALVLQHEGRHIDRAARRIELVPLLQRQVAAFLAKQTLNALEADALIYLFLHVFNFVSQVLRHQLLQLLTTIVSALLHRLNVQGQRRLYFVLLLVDFVLRLDQLLGESLAELCHRFANTIDFTHDLLMLEGNQLFVLVMMRSEVVDSASHLVLETQLDARLQVAVHSRLHHADRSLEVFLRLDAIICVSVLHSLLHAVVYGLIAHLVLLWRYSMLHLFGFGIQRNVGHFSVAAGQWPNAETCGRLFETIKYLTIMLLLILDASNALLQFVDTFCR